MRPDDLELFAQLHLGILPDGSAGEQSLEELARRYGVSVAELEGWLFQARIDPAAADEIDYDLRGPHAEAQLLALDGDAGKTLAHARTIYDQYRARLGTRRARWDDPAEKTVSDRVKISDVPHQ